MIKYVNDKELKEVLSSNKELILVFGKGLNCSVCSAVEDRVNSTYPAKFPNLKIYYINIHENPEFRGQSLIFSVPTLMLYFEDKEVHRESRIIDFTKMENVINKFFN